MLHYDYETFRQIWADADENYHHPKARLETLFPVNN